MGEEDGDLKRGVLARLRPVPRALWIIALSILLIGILILLDPTEAGQRWADNPAGEVERYLNTLVLAGTVWAVVLEGDAILAALGLAVAGGVGGVIADFLKAAGASQEEISRVLRDIRDSLKRRPARGNAESSSGVGSTATEESSRSDSKLPPPKVSEEQARARSAPSPSGKNALPAEPSRTLGRGWQLRAVTVVCAALVAGAVLSALRFCAVPVKHNDPPPPPPPPTNERVEIRGSVSQTLAVCLGKQPGAELERRIAELNKLRCEERPARFHCLVRDGGFLILPPDIRCARPAP